MGKAISSMSFMIGYFMAGFTPRKQTLHDMMAGCLVVMKKSLPQTVTFNRATETQPGPGQLIYRVILDITPLFQEPDFSALVIKGLNTGEEVELVGVKPSGGLEWVEVKCSDGLTGFIAGDTPVLDPNIKWSFAEATVNLYEQPSLQSQIKKQYHQGEEFYQVTIQKNEEQKWWKIRDMSGVEGYIDGNTKIKEE